MNIDDMTYGEIKKIAAMFDQSGHDGLSAMVGKKCIVRTYSAGVWFGEVAEKSGNEVILKMLVACGTGRRRNLSALAL